jgi:hypothetical protein
MVVDETERVIELFRGDPETFGDFLADVGGDPEEYGIASVDVLSAGDVMIAGKALAVYVSYLENSNPAWDGVDVDVVDWPRVMAELVRP